MNDVLIKYEELNEVVTQVTNIIEELEGARDRSNDLGPALAMPFMKSELTQAAQESESRWSKKRKDLAEALTTFRDRAKEVYDGFQEFDTEAASEFEASQNECVPPSGS